VMRNTPAATISTVFKAPRVTPGIILKMFLFCSKCFCFVLFCFSYKTELKQTVYDGYIICIHS
jgi:hypothetical protein